jgi:hypothetical protein
MQDRADVDPDPATARRGPPPGEIARHAVAGLVLGVAFLALLIACGGSTVGLFIQADNVDALVILVVLHAALFACASFATANAALSPRRNDDFRPGAPLPVTSCDRARARCRSASGYRRSATIRRP